MAGGIFENKMGKWAQFVVQMNHKEGTKLVKKRHSVERKMIGCGNARKWYFCEF